MANSTKKGLVKAASVMGLFTILSRMLGLVREIVRAHFLGTSIMADAFTVAFMIPNLFRRLVGEGAMTAAAVPIFIEEEKNGGKQRLSEVASNLITLFSFILSIICILFVISAGFWVESIFARGFANQPDKIALTVELTQYMFFYLLFISLAAILQAILNSFRIFGPSSFTPILLNISVVSSALFLHKAFELPVYSFVLGILVGGFLQLLFQYPYVKKAGVSLKPKFNWKDPAVQKILKLMVPGILGAGVYQINVVISQMIATYLVEGSVSSLQYSQRLEEFTLGVFVIAISTAVLPTFATLYRDKKMDKLRETLEFALRLVAYITIPATLGLIIIRFPLINLLFRTGRFDDTSVNLTAYAFLFHAMGIFFIGIGRIMVPVFYSMKDMVTPVKAAIASTIVNIAFCLILAKPLQQGGIALANSLSAVVQSLVLVWFLVHSFGHLNWKSVVSSFAKTFVAASIMAATGFVIVHYMGLEHTISRTKLAPGLLLTVVICGLLYAGLTKLMKSREFNELWSIVIRRGR